jgi:hypothetical protein
MATEIVRLLSTSFAGTTACLAVAIAWTLAASCAVTPNDAEAAAGLPCDLPTIGPVGCDSCLTNSSVVNSFPLNGLHVKKCQNPQGVRLDPALTFNPPRPACTGARLKVVDDRLTTDKGEPHCGEQTLKGATFTVSKGPKKQTLRIAALRSFTFGGRIFHGYVFTTPKSGVSLCNRDGARTVAAALGMGIEKVKPGERGGQLAAPADNLSYDLDDIALVFTGELYDNADQGMPASRGEYLGERWFNIACARDALAKLDVYGIAPHDDPAQTTDATSARRSAGLKMVTASYCRNVRYTSDGAPLRWAAAGASAPTAPAGFVVEAYWNKSGASCLGRSRLLRPAPELQLVPESVAGKVRPASPSGMASAAGAQAIRDAVNARCTGAGETPTPPTTTLPDCAGSAAPTAYDFVTFVDASPGSTAVIP